MRTSEAELRARLRFLQIARLEGWEVATNYAKGKDGNTEDPDLVEARRLAAKNKKEREAEATPSKSKKGNKDQSPAAAKQWARGEVQHEQGAIAYQQAGYSYGGANAYPSTYYNFPSSQPYYGQQPLLTQPNFWPSPYSQQAALPPPPLPSLAQPIRPIATTTGRSLVCFACEQPGHIRSNCPNKRDM